MTDELELKMRRRNEADRLRYVLQKIAEFPYVGEKAAQQMRLMAEGVLAIDAAAPAVGGEAINNILNDYWFWEDVGPLHKKEIIDAITALVQLVSPLQGRDPTVDEVRQTIADEWGSYVCYRTMVGILDCDKDKHCRCADIARAVLNEHSLASSPEQPLRGRESVREIAHRHCTCTCLDDPKVLQNHTNLCDAICDAILEYAVSSATPEQPPGCGDPDCKDPNCDYGKSRGLK